MGNREILIRAALLCAVMLVVGTAEAQRKRMPVRAEPIPDTESGRPAASAEAPTFKGRLLIYGPPSLPVGAPPEHLKPAPEGAPVAAPAVPASTPAAVAAPAPSPAPAVAPTPAPVVTPTTSVAPPSAVPIPAPAPTPAPAPRQEVAVAAPSSAAAPAPGAPVPIEMKLIESIFTCLAPGLPQDWKKAWIEITDLGSGKEKVSKFFFTNLRGDDEGEPLMPCNAQELTRRILSLNEKLPPDRRAWTRALLVIDSEGEYELSYDYPK